MCFAIGVCSTKLVLCVVHSRVGEFCPADNLHLSSGYSSPTRDISLPFSSYMFCSVLALALFIHGSFFGALYSLRLHSWHLSLRASFIHGAFDSWYLVFIVPCIHGICYSWYLFIHGSIHSFMAPFFHGTLCLWHLSFLAPLIHGIFHSWHL